ncbi:MAG TPA: hypothetical protein VE713_09940 [Pyrinomonadaceae bacterium]|jgi:hypothetical protein|nr:hypothetical protein [Pyrinomonadaceae bacterium]
MKIRGEALKSLFALGVIILVSASVLGIAMGTRSVKRGQIQREPVTDTLPPVSSKVKGLEVVNAGIKHQGEPGAEAFLVIKNKSDVGVTAYTVTFGDASVGKDGGLSTDEPVVIIEPHGKTTLSFPLSNLEKGVPIVVTGVFYADGSEEGLPIILKWMHDDRVQEKEKRDAKKGGSNQ